MALQGRVHAEWRQQARHHLGEAPTPSSTQYSVVLDPVAQPDGESIAPSATNSLGWIGQRKRRTWMMEDMEEQEQEQRNSLVINSASWEPRHCARPARS